MMDNQKSRIYKLSVDGTATPQSAAMPIGHCDQVAREMIGIKVAHNDSPEFTYGAYNSDDVAQSVAHWIATGEW